MTHLFPSFAPRQTQPYGLLRSAILACCLLATSTIFAQNGFQPVFPGLTGNALLDSLVARYKTDTVLNYTQARDTLYAKILAIDDDSLRCIYSGHTLYLDPTQDPTQYVYLNGGPLGMNAEHAYPQSKGASLGNARSDMHHLFPARVPVNEARSTKPFAEIPDAQTQQWFYKAQTLTNKPTQNADAYTESTGNAFEPREQVKGDIARAVFYMYTMYRSQLNTADPDFFGQQRATLCRWHLQDPADASELTKTWRIARYQGGKPNPFVLDCSLAYRAWCPDVVPTGCVTAVNDAPDAPVLGLHLAPNPAPTGQLQIALALPFSGTLELRFRSATGQTIATARLEQVPSGVLNVPFELADDAPRFGFLEAILYGSDKTQVSRKTIPFLAGY